MKIFVLLTVVCALSISAQAAEGSGPSGGVEYGYTFAPSIADSGFGGELFFTKSQNPSGTIADIDLDQSYLGTPDGTFNLGAFDIQLGVYITTTTVNQNGTLSWTPTAVTSMSLSGETTGSFVGAFGGTTVTDWSISPTSIDETTSDDFGFFAADPYASGTWNFAGTIGGVAAAENSSCAVLLGGTMVSLSVLAWRQQCATRS